MIYCGIFTCAICINSIKFVSHSAHELKNLSIPFLCVLMTSERLKGVAPEQRVGLAALDDHLLAHRLSLSPLHYVAQCLLVFMLVARCN